MSERLNNLTIEGATIRFRNFSGKEGKFNPPGKRNFCVFLDDETAEALKVDGWNVKYLNPKDPQDDPQAYIQVAVTFNNFPPKIFLVTSKKKTLLNEDTVDMVDYAEIANVDLIIQPYCWEVNGKTGVKAYLKTMYITIAEDEFESKYSDVPDSAKNALPDEDEIPFD